MLWFKINFLITLSNQGSLGSFTTIVNMRTWAPKKPCPLFTLGLSPIRKLNCHFNYQFWSVSIKRMYALIGLWGQITDQSYYMLYVQEALSIFKWGDEYEEKKINKERMRKIINFYLQDRVIEIGGNFFFGMKFTYRSLYKYITLITHFI